MFSFDIGSIPDPFVPAKPVHLAYVNENGVLVLSAGQHHDMLVDADLYDSTPTENFSITQDVNNPSQVIVSAYGFSQPYLGLSRPSPRLLTTISH